MPLDDYDVLRLAWKTCLSPRYMFIRCEYFFILMTDTQLYKVQDSGENGSNTTTSEIAFQTGFSEQSAINRAFKRLTSQSPLDYRKDHSTSQFGLNR